MRIVKLTREELLEVLRTVLLEVEDDDIPGRLYEVKMGFAEDGFKVKINNATWSPPVGTVKR